jgi:hypothetical protein
MIDTMIKLARSRLRRTKRLEQLVLLADYFDEDDDAALQRLLHHLRKRYARFASASIDEEREQ